MLYMGCGCEGVSLAAHHLGGCGRSGHERADADGVRSGLGLEAADAVTQADFGRHVTDADREAHVDGRPRDHVVVRQGGHAELSTAGAPVRVAQVAGVVDDRVPAVVGPVTAGVLPVVPGADRRHGLRPVGEIGLVLELDVRVAPQGALTVRAHVGLADDLVAGDLGRVDALGVRGRACRAAAHEERCKRCHDRQCECEKPLHRPSPISDKLHTTVVPCYFI